MATSAVLGQQHTQSITFSGPSVWTPGTTVNLDVFLTFGGYNAIGLSYWLEVQSALAPYITITNIQWFTFPQHGQPVYPIFFTGGIGSEVHGVKNLIWAELSATPRRSPFLRGLIKLTR